MAAAAERARARTCGRARCCYADAVHRAELIACVGAAVLSCGQPASPSSARGESSVAAVESSAPQPIAAPGVASSEPEAATGSVAPATSAAIPEPPSCSEPSAPAGFLGCRGVELTGAPPCEAICERRRAAAPTRCCKEPRDVVILDGALSKTLLALPTCSFVPPDCAHVHGHGNMDSDLRVLPGSPPEIVYVEGGCETRAIAHGYVPPGVAAWTGCEHRVFKWDGTRIAEKRRR